MNLHGTGGPELQSFRCCRLGRAGLIATERLAAGCPGSKAAFDEVRQHFADIALLRRIVVLARIVPADGECPASFALLERFQEPGSVVHILVRIEHLLDGRETVPVVEPIELHAAHIDQLHAGSFGSLKSLHRLRLIEGVNGIALQIEGIGMQMPPYSGFSQTYGEEDTQRDVVFLGGLRHLAFAEIGLGDRVEDGAKRKENRRRERLQRAHILASDLHFDLLVDPCGFVNVPAPVRLRPD